MMREGPRLSRPNHSVTTSATAPAALCRQRKMSIVPPLMPWRTRSVPEPEIQFNVL